MRGDRATFPWCPHGVCKFLGKLFHDHMQSTQIASMALKTMYKMYLFFFVFMVDALLSAYATYLIIVD